MDYSLRAEEFDYVVGEYLTHGKDKKGIELFAAKAQVAFVFSSLAERIYEMCKKATQTDVVMRDQMLDEAVAVCFDKMSRFKMGKGRAFNFFTIVILCHFRQVIGGRSNG